MVVTLIGLVSCVAGIARTRGPPLPVVAFWGVAFVVTLAANMAAIPWQAPAGSVSMNLQPLAAMLMVFAAWSLGQLPSGWRAPVAVVAFAESAWTTARLVAIQTTRLPADLLDLSRTSSTGVVTVIEDFRVSQARKLRDGTVFLSDTLGGAAPWVMGALLVMAAALIAWVWLGRAGEGGDGPLAMSSS